MTPRTSECATASAAGLFEAFSLLFSSLSLCCSITAVSSLSLCSRDSTSSCALTVYNKAQTCLHPYVLFQVDLRCNMSASPYLAKIVHHLRLDIFYTQAQGNDLFMVCNLKNQKDTLSVWQGINCIYDYSYWVVAIPLQTEKRPPGRADVAARIGQPTGLQTGYSASAEFDSVGQKSWYEREYKI